MCAFLFANVFLFEEGHGENQVCEVMRSVFKTLPNTKIDSAIETPKIQSIRRHASRWDHLAKTMIFVYLFFSLKNTRSDIT